MAAAVLAVAAMLGVTAMLAAVWASPLASANAGPQPRAAAPSPAAAPAPAPAPVKFYIVLAPGNGHAESLFAIAAKTLGDGSQFMEIFNLNKGRLQPNGRRLTHPQLIEPGWILQLPADAAGPGVRFGPLPVVTAPTAHQPSRSAGTGSAIMISEALLAFLTAGLAFRVIRHRIGPARRPGHVRAPGPDVGRLQVAVTDLQASDRDRALPDGDRQAAEVRQQTPVESAALRQASERDAAELRSALLEMQAELGRMAAYVAGNLRSTARPMTAPAARPKTQPKAQPATRRTTKPATRPVAPLSQPAEPATPSAKPAGRSRQFRAMRLIVLTVTIPILFGLTAATGELALHGYGLFVFRSAGTGATQQGPSGSARSQPPVAHHLRARGPARLARGEQAPSSTGTGASHRHHAGGSHG